jgi:hypothetical protein
MKQHLFRTGAALAIALFVFVGVSEAGISARKKEKSDVYAKLKPWEKKYIDRGEVAPGFTPDMVYIAMGKSDKVENKDVPEGHVDLWTYSRCYPEPLVVHRYMNTKFTAESGFQAASLQNSVGTSTVAVSSGTLQSGSAQTAATAGSSGGSISKTGGPQGGTMEPANVQSYTIQILFENGKVAKMSCSPNIN